MPDETYRILYVVDPSGAVRGLAQVDSALRKTQGEIQKTAGMLKALGRDAPGVRQYTAELKKLDVELKSKVVDARAAEKALKDVGKGNRSLAGMTKQAKALEAQLKATQGAAAAATPALAGVGAGSTIGAGRGGAGGGGGIGATGGILTAGLGRHLAYATFRKVTGAVGSSVGDRREFFAESADMAGQYRKDLKELAVLKGKPGGADEELMREDLAFQRKTLLNPEDSRTFRLEFGGAVDPALKARDKNNDPRITPDTANRLEVEAARFTARYGLDPTTGGRMAGLLGVTQNVPDAGHGVGIMAETMEQLNVAGVGKVRDMAKHLFALSGGMLAPEENEVDDDGVPVKSGGRFPSYPAMAARFAATTISTVGGASEAKSSIRRVDRMMRKTKDKNGDFRRMLGVKDDDDFETMLRKFEPEVLKPNGDEILKDYGYTNSVERRDIIAAAKLRQQVDANLGNKRMKAAAAGALADSAKFDGSIGGQQQRAENSEFAARIEVGLAGERLKAARTATRAAMIRDDTLKPGPIGRLADMGISATTLGGVSGEDLRVDTQVFRSLQERGEKVGVDVLGKHPGLDLGPRMMNLQDEKGLAREFDAASREVEAAEMLRRGAQMIQQGAAKLGKGGPQGPPPPGNGGAGVGPIRR